MPPVALYNRGERRHALREVLGIPEIPKKVVALLRPEPEFHKKRHENWSKLVFLPLPPNHFFTGRVYQCEIPVTESLFIV